MPARPLLDDRTIFEFATSHRSLMKTSAATAWFLRQFDERLLKTALTCDLDSEEATAAAKPKKTDLKTMIRWLRTTLANPEEPASLRSKCYDELRSFMRLGAACHPQYRKKRGEFITTDGDAADNDKEDKDDKSTSEAFQESFRAVSG